MTRPAGSSRLLRSMNESATLAHLLDRGPLTRGELRQLTGLSKPTTSDVLRSLTEAGLAIVVGRHSAGPGPNAEIYAANPQAGYAAAVCVREVGAQAGPSLTAALIDLNAVVHARIELAVDLSTVDPVDVVAEAVGRLAEQASIDLAAVAHIHLGVPGSYDPTTGEIHHIDVPGFRRPGLVDDLADRLAATVVAENDVNLAAIAERQHGVATEVSGFALFWLDEGLGLAIDLGGELLRGARGGAGEIGYVPVGMQSVGGRRVDLQDLIGGAAVVTLAAQHGIVATTAGAAIAAAGTADDEATGRFLDAIAVRIAHGLAAVAGVLDPPLIVLAGTVARAGGEQLAERVRAALAATTSLTVTIAVTTITDDAVLLGALDAGLHAVRESLISGLRAH